MESRRRDAGPSPGPSAARGEDLVDQTVVERLARREDLVPLDVLADLLDVAVAVLGQGLLEPLAHAQDLTRLDLDVGPLAAALAVGLVDEDTAVGQAVALAGRAGGQQHRRGAGSLAEAGGL